MPVDVERIDEFVVSLEEEAGTVEHVVSTTGVRAGCVLGNIGFDVCVHHFVYQFLLKELDDFIIRSLTDDMPYFFKPEVQSDEGW